jgi:hypothetical protein
MVRQGATGAKGLSENLIEKGVDIAAWEEATA